MSKEEFIKYLDESSAHGTPFINFTEFYSFALIPKGDKWIETSYDFEDKAIIETSELSPEDAFFHFCEEVEKAMGEEVEVFYLNRWKEFKESLTGNEQEKLVALIKELTTNTETYGKDLPIVVNEAGLAALKAKL